MVLAMLSLGLAGSASASHFRYGSLTWRTITTDATKRTVEFKVSQAWRRSNFGSISAGSNVSTDVLYFGDGSRANVTLAVTSVDLAADSFYGEAVIVHTYPASTAYTAYFSNCCRLSTLVNNRDGNWYVGTQVSSGTSNSSPVSTMPPVVNLATGQTNPTFKLAANDPDGDPLTYTVATAADLAGNGFINAPGLAVNSAGVVTFSTSNTTIGALYNAVIKVSDGKTSILVDFLIKITPVSAAPQFDYSLTPTNGRVYQVAPGTPVAFSVRATDSDAGDNVTLQAIGLPPGAVMNPVLPVSGNPVSSSFSWTPTLNTLGTSVISFVAQDAVGVQTTTSVTIQVSTKPTFDVPPTPSLGTSRQVTPGTAISQLVQVSSIDPNSPVRILSATGLPATASYTPALPTTAANPTRTTLNWTPVLADWGVRIVTFTAANSYNDQKTHTLQYIVNSAPSFTSAPTPASLNVVAGQPFHYSITTTDPDLPYGDEMEIEHPVLPAWLTLTDNGDGTASLDGTPTVANAGLNRVDLVAADIYHHGASYGLVHQVFDINVIPCTVQATAQNVSVSLDANGQVTVSSAQVDNGSTASCGIASMTVSPANFTCANIGPNSVTLTVTDANGYVSTATATVTVQDNLAPTALAKNITVQLDANGNASITGADVNNGSTDNCSVASATVAPAAFTCANVGANPVTLTVTDAAGNVNTATATVTVAATLALLETHVDVNCYGASNGSIDLQVISGTGSTFAWTGPNGFTAATEDLTNLSAGTYSVTVTTPTGCSATKTVTLNQPPNLTPVAGADAVSAVACTPLIISASTLLANDTDPQNATLQVADVLTPSSGTVVKNANGTYTYTPAAGFTGTATFQYVIKKSDATVSYSANGHFYEYIPSYGICWTAARDAAAARTYQGMRGYLATITSAGENAFAASKLQGNGWIGAADDLVEGQWRWKTGPEAGQQFWQGLSNGRTTGAYANWQGGEPNDYNNEDYAHFYSGSGTWNDYANCVGGNIQGYVVEYGGLESCIPVLTATGTVTVTVAPAPAPTVLTKNITVVLDAAGNATITGAQVNNGSRAACGIATLTVAPSTFSCANLGTNTVTLTATSNYGGTATGTATVTVVDNTRPVARAQNLTVYLDANGSASITAAQVDNNSTDNCGIASRTLSVSQFTCANRGTNAVVLTVADGSGNTNTANATVTVIDNTLPTITAPAAVAVNTDPGQCTASNVALGTATAADNCSATVTNDAPATFAKGANTVTWTATDAAGNVATATQTVTVTDNELPTITAPVAVTATADAGQCTASNVVLGSATAGDNCTGVVVTNNAPSTFDKGNTTVTWTATDAAGNVATATQTVTVTDNELPTITAPVAKVVSTDAGQCTATNVALGQAVAADNCTGVVVTNNAPAFFTKGANTVTWMATDAAGNVATATQLVTVNDTERPTIMAPMAKVVSTDAGQCSATSVALGTPVTADNCPNLTTTNDAPATFAKGTTTVTWTVTDAAGNVATATQLVTVNDTQLPTITAPVAKVVSTDAGQCSATNVDLGSAVAADNCSVTVSNDAPSTFPKGETTVTWTATDASGNVATATQTVTVNDTERPVLAALPNLSVNAPATLCGAVVRFAPTATDNCGATVTTLPASGSTFAVGTTTVQVTATDASGNTSTGSFTVTVRDVTAPTALAQNVSVTLVNGQATVTAAQVNNGSADACGIKTVSLSQTSFDCANIGANTVTLTVTDNHNLVSTATAVVTVRGDVPVVTIAATPASVNFSAKSVVIYLGYGAQTATLTASSGALSGVRYAWTAAPGLSTLAGASTVFAPTAEGTYSFTVTATSATGCSGTGTVKVYVEDVRCGNPNSNSLNEKVQICHNGQTICVSINALSTHLGHGDKVGDCNVSFPRGTAEAAPAPAAALAAANELSAFPNPMAENATVNFRTATSGPAQVVVYNELGQRVATLFDGPATAGEPHTLTLQGHTLASGLYVCRLVTNGKTQSLRLTVVR